MNNFANIATSAINPPARPVVRDALLSPLRLLARVLRAGAAFRRTSDELSRADHRDLADIGITPWHITDVAREDAQVAFRG
jgi:uncharacterized protein YjiS (DUF1127 family)